MNTLLCRSFFVSLLNDDLKNDGRKIGVLILGLRNGFYLHQNKFSACKSADDCKQFFVSFVAVSQGFTEISAANRESLNWTSDSVF